MTANRATRRASAAQYPKTLDAWSHDRMVKGLRLPAVGDGPERLVDYELPNLATFAKLGDIPEPLVAMAIKAEWDPAFSPLSAAPEEQRTYYDLMCWVIAWGLRKPNVVEELGSLAAAATWVDANVHDTQKVAIWQRAQHLLDPTDVLTALQALSEEVKGSEVNTVADLETFRDGGRGAPVVADGSGNGSGPVQDAGDHV